MAPSTSHFCPRVPQAMGVTSDQEVVQLVGSEAEYAQAMLPSLRECATLAIFSQVRT